MIECNLQHLNNLVLWISFVLSNELKVYWTDIIPDYVDIKPDFEQIVTLDRYHLHLAKDSRNYKNVGPPVLPFPTKVYSSTSMLVPRTGCTMRAPHVVGPAPRHVQVFNIANWRARPENLLEGDWSFQGPLDWLDPTKAQYSGYPQTDELPVTLETLESFPDTRDEAQRQKHDEEVRQWLKFWSQLDELREMSMSTKKLEDPNPFF